MKPQLACAISCPQKELGNHPCTNKRETGMDLKITNATTDTMRKLTIIYIASIVAAFAQSPGLYQPVPATQYPALETILNSKPSSTIAVGVPVGGCTAGKDYQINSTNGDLYECVVTGSPGTWQKIGGASPLSTFWVSSSSSIPTNGVNLGLLSTGLVKVTISGAVATPSTAIANTDFLAAAAINLAAGGAGGVTGLLPLANGGTGTATPALIAGTNVSITGTWPNQTINSSGSGGGITAGTGPVTFSGTGSVVTTITPTGITAGACGVASVSYCIPTYNAAGQAIGLITAALGGGGASAANTLTDALISRPSATEVDVSFPTGGTNYSAPPFVTNFTTLAKEVITTASVCTTQYIYWDPVANTLKMDSTGTGSGQFLLNAGASTVITAITNYNASGYPQYSVPLYRVRAGCTTAGQWETLVVTTGYWDDRSVYNTYVLKAGASGGLTMSYSSGINTISIDQTQPLTAPWVKTVATNSDPGCTTTADFGKTWTDNTSATTTAFKICGAVSSSPAWVTTLGGGGGTGTVITTGTPASGNLAKFSGSLSITNGDLSGDVTTSGTLVTAINNVNSFGAGTCGDSTHYPVLTMTAKGLITNCTPISGGGGGGVTIGGAVGGSPSVGGVLYTDGSSNLAQSPGLVYTSGSNKLALGTGSADGVIAVPSAWGLSIDNGQTAKFRMLAASGDIYFQNTNSSGNINFSGYGGVSAGRVNFVSALSTFVNTTVGGATQFVFGYDGVNTSGTTSNFYMRAGQVQGSTKLFDIQDNSGTSLWSVGATGILNMSSQSSFLFNGKTCVLSGSAISCT